MTRFLVKISVLGMVSVLLYLSLILATEIKYFSDLLSYEVPLFTGTTHQWSRLGEADTTHNIDVVIVGSSLAQSIDVREFQKFNFRAFNLASGSQSPIQTSYLIDKYFDTFNPKLVIWDVHPYTFSVTGVESTVDLVSNCHKCYDMLPLLVNTNSTLALSTFLKRMMLKPFEDKDFEAPNETKHGKYISSGLIETDIKAPDLPVKTNDFHFIGLEIQKEIFESELRKLKKRNIPVVLVYSPKSIEFIRSFKNQQEWFDYYNAIKRQGLADDFLNFNEIFSGISATTSPFFDLAHLTAEGVNQYNKTLFQSLSGKLGNLKKPD